MAPATLSQGKVLSICLMDMQRCCFGHYTYCFFEVPIAVAVSEEPQATTPNGDGEVIENVTFYPGRRVTFCVLLFMETVCHVL